MTRAKKLISRGRKRARRAKESAKVIVSAKLFRIKMNAANSASFLNLASGLLSMISSINQRFGLAITFLFLSVFLDFIDGRLARAFKAESLFGLELDSFSDLISFGVAPAVLVMSFFAVTPAIIVLAILFVGCGAYRLSRYNTLKARDAKKSGFLGMPITINGLIFPVLYILNADSAIFMAALLAASILMVSKIRISKL